MASPSQQSHRRDPAAQSINIVLPNGLWLADRHLRAAGLHALTGYDEAYLLQLHQTLPPARWVSELLACCLTYLGEISPVPVDYVHALPVGDREALLLHLRKLTFGDRMSCILDCPQCETKLDIDLHVSDLLLPPYAQPAYWFRIPLPAEKLLVTFRLPTGADQEAVADLASHDPRNAAAAILERCLHSVSRDGVTLEAIPNELPHSLLEPIAAFMAEHDPQAELLLHNECPACAHPFNVLLDMRQYLAEEINQRLRYLYREVHLLAWYYHWSEADILQMTRPHRKIYLDLLDETLSEVAP